MTELLEKWDSFYVIVGSAGGALIGLQFVVLTLIAERPPRDMARAGAAFSTPTIVHFSVVLGLSALLRMPWDSATAVAMVCGLVGLAGAAYVLLTVWRMRVQTAYKPDMEDAMFHVLMPLAAYVVIAISAYVVFQDLRLALFATGGAALLLLLAGIHNAWDGISYHVLNRAPQQRAD
ncbi:MAG: hypothetical protein JO056_13365 [Alphaproteobacteria bacterium]|nr:hypothetical protein [Alphaproteobacteria bacterium]